MGRGANTGNSATMIGSRRAVANAESAVKLNASRIAELGHWPSYINADSLTERVPSYEQCSSGFDAGIACALDLIPRDRQALSAGLHAASAPRLVEQVRREAKTLDPDSETVWWLAACSICEEGEINQTQFIEQIASFNAIAGDRSARVTAAVSALAEMLRSFEIDELGIPFAVADGGMQGAYIAGHPISAMYAEKHELYFIGTMEETLGLEDFEWSDPERSGPVHGSRQFVKCADHAEYVRAVNQITSRS